MNSIQIIGNNGSNKALSDGGRIKTRLYFDLLSKEGYDVHIIDTDKWQFHLISIIFKIIVSLIKKDKFIIMAGPKGCRFFIPLVSFLNVGNRSNVVFCPLGVGTIDKLLKSKTTEEVNDFINKGIFKDAKDKKIGKMLRKFQYVVLQNEVLRNCYKNFYNLDNTVVLKNFRVFTPKDSHTETDDDVLKVIFYSRVCENKGILDLIESVKKCNDNGAKIHLDIYGDNQLSNKNFLSEIKEQYIKYCGTIDQKDSFSLLSKYDLFCLPTKYHGEGTPGSLIESLLAGTPVVVSSFSQVFEFVKDEYNGFIYKINDNDDLISKLSNIYENRVNLFKFRLNAIESSKEFTYDFNRSSFLKFFGTK